MSLTSENMESRPDIISHCIFRDIARMDQSQLNEYVRRAFSGNKTGPSFYLPRELDRMYDNPFFDWWFDMNVHGPTTDGRDAPSPANFFAHFHDGLGSSKRGTWS